jgi:transcriptional regulator with XRE-family HTH domain
MNKTEEKIKKLAAENPVSDWKDKVAYRKENKDWLQKSTRIALRILDALEEKNWNQTDFANALGVTRQQVSKLLKGGNDFKLSTIAKIEEVLGIKIQAILAEDEIVVTEEIIRARVTNELAEYHRKWSLTQQYFNLKNIKINPSVVMALEPSEEDTYAKAG